VYGWAKMGNDDTTFIGLAASLIGLCVPVPFTHLWVRSPLPWLVVGFFLVWLVVGVGHDARGLNIWSLGDAFNWAKMKAVPGRQVRVVRPIPETRCTALARCVTRGARRLVRRGFASFREHLFMVKALSQEACPSATSSAIASRC
jgi:hypothetical protein